MLDPKVSGDLSEGDDGDDEDIVIDTESTTIPPTSPHLLLQRVLLTLTLW